MNDEVATQLASALIGIGLTIAYRLIDRYLPAEPRGRHAR